MKSGKHIARYFDGLITKQYKGLKKYLGEHAQKHTVFTHIIKFSLYEERESWKGGGLPLNKNYMYFQ